MQIIRRRTASVRNADPDYRLRARDVVQQALPIANSAVSVAPACWRLLNCGAREQLLLISKYHRAQLKCPAHQVSDGT